MTPAGGFAARVDAVIPRLEAHARSRFTRSPITGVSAAADELL